MPIWNVQDGDGKNESIEAELVATEGGALIALTDDGLLSRAWAPGHWRGVQRICDAGLFEPPDRDDDSMDASSLDDRTLVGLPRR